MQNISNKERKLRTNIKSAQGSFALAEILAVVYIFKACISKNFDFYFSTYGSEFIMKSSSLSEGYPGALSTVMTVVLVLLYNALFIAAILLANKQPKYMWVGLTLYSLDCVWMTVGYATQYIEPFTTEKLIDVIIHIFILLFLIVGVDSVKKLKKLENKPHKKRKRRKKKSK